MARTTSKENTSKLFKRYVWLVDIIYRSRHITFEQISDRWLQSQLNEEGEELPRRTFYNHRKAIQEMFEIEIKCDRSGGNYFYIENSEDLERGGVRQWLINTFAVNNLINESHRLKSRILFEHIPSGQQFLTHIIEAMRDNLSIEITYQSYRHDHPSTFVVDPYCIKIFNQRWYLAAYNSYNNDMRIYALDRMSELTTTDRNFVIDENFSAEEYFIHNYGISGYVEPMLITIAVNRLNCKDRYFKSLPLHHSQEIIEENEEQTKFRYFVRPTYEFCQELLSHGKEIEVLSPTKIRNEIADIIAAQNVIYQKGKARS